MQFLSADIHAHPGVPIRPCKYIPLSPGPPPLFISFTRPLLSRRCPELVVTRCKWKDRVVVSGERGRLLLEFPRRELLQPLQRILYSFHGDSRQRARRFGLVQPFAFSLEQLFPINMDRSNADERTEFVLVLRRLFSLSFVTLLRSLHRFLLNRVSPALRNFFGLRNTRKSRR